MRTIFYIVLFLGIPFLAISQDAPKVGDELKINEPYGQKFNHVSFPQPNILIKRGKVANYNSVYGVEVVVSEVKLADEDNTYVMLTKKDGTKFFGYLSEVRANYHEALTSGELEIKK
ncbi:hypothetical protein [Psychroserpens sp.]|uniref:hypothetical protein n=1 Tax=Psychroserpens sp. TaxID=2020870 RepID=UPI003C751B06